MAQAAVSVCGFANDSANSVVVPVGVPETALAGAAAQVAEPASTTARPARVAVPRRARRRRAVAVVRTMVGLRSGEAGEVPAPHHRHQRCTVEPDGEGPWLRWQTRGLLCRS